jgi:hypothetical protein
VFQRVDALSFSTRVGLTTVWGDYWERSEQPHEVEFVPATQELSNAANGNHAVYSNLDLGAGIDAVMLRISLPSGTSGAEIRLESVAGPVVGSCAIPTTGDKIYRTISCPVDQSLAKGRQNLVIRFTGLNSTLRFNWFAFWARETTQNIDDIQKVQSKTQVNRPAPSLPMTGAAVRTQALLPGSTEQLARAYGLWSPGKSWECPKWLHDTYWTKGEDGKVYPTWHPPVDFNPETGKYCTYGHEHGDDPRGSEVFSIAKMPPFGFVNEQHSPNDPTHQRHEDHFGHKVFVANNWTMYNEYDAKQTRSCDLIAKIHMGSHSADALTNTAHEMFATGQCEGLEPFNVKHFALFGAAGRFKEAEALLCGLPVNPGIAPNPLSQPNGGVHRAIPAKDCYVRGTETEQTQAVKKRTIEYWLTSFVGGSFYFTITNPSRFYDPASPSKITRIIDACYDPAQPLSKTLLCQEAVAAATSKVTWDDPRSPFRGSVRNNSHFAAFRFNNAPAAVMYTDAYGRYAQTTPDPTRNITLRQLVPVTGFRYKVDGQASAFPPADYSAYGKNGLRAPN